jgi:hypothetical protein
LRVIEFAQVLISLQEHVLGQVQSIFAVAGDSQEIVINLFFPTRDEEVVGLYAAAGCLTNQVGILDRPKNQTLAPGDKTLSGGKKLDGINIV